MERKGINSVEELLMFFKQTTTKIFYIGPFYSITAVCLNDYIPTFEMVTCCDPFKGALPFVKVLQCFKQHTCVGIGCQNIILRQQEVISYLKGKSENPNIIVFDPDSQTERICQENGFNCWVIPSQLHGVLENKVKIIDLLKKAGIPFIPNILSTISSYQNLKDLTKEFKTQKIVIQDQNGYGGIGTMFIFNETDYDSFKSILQNGKIFKITPFRNLKTFSISSVATKVGTFVGPLVADMIGHEQLASNPAGYCGNQIRHSYFQEPSTNLRVHQEITRYARKFGEFLYEEGLYKGFFGLDFAVDVDTKEVILLEMNARLTGSTAFTFMVYEAQGHRFPIYLYHCAEYMGLNLNLDIEAINNQWSNPRKYNKQLSFMIIRPKTREHYSLPFDFPVNTWKLDKEGKPNCVNKCTFRLSELDQDEFLFIPSKGLAMGSLITKRLTQNYSFKLLQEIKPVINKFRKLRIQGAVQ